MDGVVDNEDNNSSDSPEPITLTLVRGTTNDDSGRSCHCYRLSPDNFINAFPAPATAWISVHTAKKSGSQQSGSQHKNESTDSDYTAAVVSFTVTSGLPDRFFMTSTALSVRTLHLILSVLFYFILHLNNHDSLLLPSYEYINSSEEITGYRPHFSI